MRVLDMVPDEHRRILHRALTEAAENGELTFLAYNKSPYYQVQPETLRRLNASSIVHTHQGRQQRTFEQLAAIFAREERIIPWWMWLAMRFSDRGAIIRTDRIEHRKLVFIRQDIADLLATELKKRFGKPTPYEREPLIPAAAAPAAVVAAAHASGDSGQPADATAEDSANSSGSWGEAGSAAPRDHRALEDTTSMIYGGEDVDEAGLNAEMKEMLEYMHQLGFPQHQIQQILKDPELFRVMQTLKQVKNSEAELKKLEAELLNLRLSNPEFGFAAQSPHEAIDRIRELKEEKEREMVMQFLRGQLLERITVATQEALQAQAAATVAASIPVAAETQAQTQTANPQQPTARADATPPPPAGEPPTLQEQIQAVQKAVSGSAIVAEIQNIQRIPHEAGDRLTFDVQITQAVQAVQQAAIVARAMEEVGFKPNDFQMAAPHPQPAAHAHHHHAARHEPVHVETSLAKTLELAMQRHHHVPASGNTAKGFGIGF